MPNSKPSLSTPMPNSKPLPNPKPSPSDDDSDACCRKILLSSLAIFVTMLVISYYYYDEAPLNNSLPIFYIEKIHIPSLKNPNSYNATKQISNSIIIDLKFERGEADVPLIYQDLNITLFYNSSAVGSTAGSGFYPGNTGAVERRAVVEAAAMPWEDAFRKISGGSTVALRAELAVKYWPCDEHRCDDKDATAVVVAADLEVDSSGAGVSKNPIRLN